MKAAALSIRYKLVKNGNFLCFKSICSWALQAIEPGPCMVDSSSISSGVLFGTTALSAYPSQCSYMS